MSEAELIRLMNEARQDRELAYLRSLNEQLKKMEKDLCGPSTLW